MSCWFSFTNISKPRTRNRRTYSTTVDFWCLGQDFPNAAPCTNFSTISVAEHWRASWEAWGIPGGWAARPVWGWTSWTSSWRGGRTKAESAGIRWGLVREILGWFIDSGGNWNCLRQLQSSRLMHRKTHWENGEQAQLDTQAGSRLQPAWMSYWEWRTCW